MEFTI